MDDFEITPGDYIFELTEKTWIGFLVSYYAPFTKNQKNLFCLQMQIWKQN